MRRRQPKSPLPETWLPGCSPGGDRLVYPFVGRSPSSQGSWGHGHDGGFSGGGTLTIYTDSPNFAFKVLPERLAQSLAPADLLPPAQESLLRAVLGDGLLSRTSWEGAPWSLLLLAKDAPRSNYDLLIEWARSHTPPPHRTACLAGRGTGFHGFKGRGWAALPGNLHLSVYFAPGRPVERFEVAFTVLAALSVVDALDRVPGLEGRAGIKWVNDVVVDEAKVAGVLAYTQTQNRIVSSAVLGMGVNVLTLPELEPTPFVPAATSVSHALGTAPDGLQASLLESLLEALDRNYEVLLDQGYRPLLERYRERSVILGREVTICSEDSDELPEVIAHGKARGLGEGLEIHLEEKKEPVTRGRLILGALAPATSSGDTETLSAHPRLVSAGAGRHG